MSAQQRERPGRTHLAIGLAVIASLVVARGAVAEPRGGQVIEGQATVTQDGSHTQIETTTRRTRMRWDGFDIAVDESVHVQQPNAGSTLVNQVSDASITQIDGSLTSNGNVWILNPAGVYFGGTAIVEVAGLIAAAGTITDQAYVTGARHFSGVAGEVHNEGTLRAGAGGVALIGRAVENHGQIVTRGGDLILAAGEDVLLMRHDTFIQVRMPHLDIDPERPAVLNTGALDAGTGRARLASGDFLGLAIRNAGTIHAQDIEIEGGPNSVVEVAGVLDASADAPGAEGGRIAVTAGVVSVDGALIDASGDAGGGEVWIGGEAAGRGELRNARGVFVADGSEIRADATGTGDGGEIVVWGDEIAQVEGRLSARGGPGGGDGGFVETSSKGRLQVAADVDVGATNGGAGTWLLDPVDVTILQTPTMTTFEPVFDFTQGLAIAASDGTASEISVDSLVAALERGGIVVVTTQASGSDPGQPGDITVSSDILIDDPARVAPTAAAELRLRAAGSILLEGEVGVAGTVTGFALSVSLLANDSDLLSGGLGQAADTDKRKGDVTIRANVTTRGGSFLAQGTNVTVESGVVIDTTRSTGDGDGGDVSLFAFDLAERGLLAGDPDPSEGRTTIDGTILTGGGRVDAIGKDFDLGISGNIDAYRADPLDPQTGSGNVAVEQTGQVSLDGDVKAETISIQSGTGGSGDVVASGTLSAREIELLAGDGAGGAGTDARVWFGANAEFTAADDPNAPPDSFAIVQDGEIRQTPLDMRTDLPSIDQFGGDNVTNMLYLLATRDGDIEVGVDPNPGIPSPFFESDLVLNAPDSIDVVSPLESRNLTLLLENGFTVTSALAPNLAVADPGAGPGIESDDGWLIIHAGLGGDGDLDFEDDMANPVRLTARRIALRAGSLGIGANLGESASAVNLPDSVQLDNTSSGSSFFEIRQDAPIHSDDLPDVGQFPALAGGDGDFEGMEYVLASHSGSVTIADAAKVEDSKLTAIGLQQGTEGIVLDEKITVRTADLGGQISFLVTPELLDGLELDNPDVVGDVLALRANAGLLFFSAREGASEGDDPEPLRIEADRIGLFGRTIDVVTNRPVFQSDATTSPKTLVFQQGDAVTDALLPTKDNFPDELGPSELFVVQSLTDVMLTHDPGNARGWGFPVQPGAQVILVGTDSVAVRRIDGKDLVLTAQDQLWSPQISLEAEFSPTDPGEFEPIVPAAVDADDVVIRGFDPETDGDIDFAVAVGAIEQPATAPNEVTIEQDGGFALLGAAPADNGLPDDLAVTGGFQPTIYRLRSHDGSIRVENAEFGDTMPMQSELQLLLVVDDADEFIDFDGSSTLFVDVLVADHAGDFRVGEGTDAASSDGALIHATDLIMLTAGALQTGTLSFTTDDVLLTTGPDGRVRLEAGADGNSGSFVDARTGNPMFDTDVLEFITGADLVSGLPSLAPETLPQPTQFVRTLPIGRYTIQSVAGDVEINDPSQILPIAEAVVLIAGASGTRTLTVRADVPGSDLVLIDPAGTTSRSVLLQGGRIILEAPYGYVDAGDPRVGLALAGLDASLVIRQNSPILLTDDFEDPGGTLKDSALRLPDRRQILGLGAAVAPFAIQSVTGLLVGETFAERVSGRDLTLVAGITDDVFDLAEGSVRPGSAATPANPDAVYDRLADFDHDGDVDADDRTLFAAFEASVLPGVVIDDPAAGPFDLELARLSILSNPGKGLPIGLGSVHIQTESDQLYGDEIVLLGDTELTARAAIETLTPTLTAPASSITFERAIDGNTPGDDSLIVNVTNRVQFQQDVGETVRLGHLEVNLEQLLQFQDPPPTPRVQFGMDLAQAEAAGVPFDPMFRVRADTILLNAQAGDGNSRFVRARVPDRATFFRRDGDLSFELGDATTPGRFVMGLNEKLTLDAVDSKLSILANGGTVTVGDLSAGERIDVRAHDIHILRRGKGPVLRANGELVRDNGTDFVARNIDFQFAGSDGPNAGEILHRSQIGSGKDARFGIADPANAPAFMSDFSVLALQFNVLGSGGVPFDGVPDGLSRVELARIFAPERPRVPIAVPASQRIRNTEALETLGIRLREPTAAELRDAARGAAIFSDLGSTSAGDDLRVSEARLVADEVEETARLYRQVFGEQGERASRIREILESVIDDYKRSTGARRVVGFELRRYVYNRPSSQFHAYQQLQELDSLFRHHRRSGLTRSEYGEIQRRWLQAIRPEGITVRELSEFIHPSRYVRSRDILDVFTD